MSFSLYKQIALSPSLLFVSSSVACRLFSFSLPITLSRLCNPLFHLKCPLNKLKCNYISIPPSFLCGAPFPRQKVFNQNS